MYKECPLHTTIRLIFMDFVTYKFCKVQNLRHRIKRLGTTRYTLFTHSPFSFVHFLLSFPIQFQKLVYLH